MYRREERREEVRGIPKEGKKCRNERDEGGGGKLGKELHTDQPGMKGVCVSDRMIKQERKMNHGKKVNNSKIEVKIGTLGSA